MISRKDFLAGNFKHNSNGMKEHPVLTFLRKHKDNAYTADEISKTIKFSVSRVRQVLAESAKKGIIKRRVPYYAYV